MRAALVSTWGSPKKYLGAFLDTANRHGLQPQNFDNTDWPGADWTEIPWYRKSEGQRDFLRKNSMNYDAVIFTDSYDVVFAAGMDEIMRKFEALNSPIVAASECYCWPNLEKAAIYPTTPHRCRYLNAGMWIAKMDAAIPFAEELASIAADRTKDDQQIMVDMFLSGKHSMKLDTACSLCFCCNLDSQSFLDFSGSRIKTTDTGEEPCLFHGNGGSDLSRIIAHITK